MTTLNERDKNNIYARELRLTAEQWRKGEIICNPAILDCAAAALEALSPVDARTVIPEGWQLVPKEPTPEMTHQASLAVCVLENGGIEWGINAAYRAMLKFAPGRP